MRRFLLAGLLGCTVVPALPSQAPLVSVQGPARLDSAPLPPESPPLRDTPPPGPALPLSPPGPGDGPIGTPHRAIVSDADPQGRWVLICQARADTDGNGRIDFWGGLDDFFDGDKASQYLVRGSGEGERIIALITRDPSGRWLVVGRDDDEVLLLDLERGTSIVLVPSSTALPDQFHPVKPSTTAFDPSGQYLVYPRHSEQRMTLVVRHLESGVETIVDPGPGSLLAVGWEGSAWLRIRSLRDDRNGDGQIQFPNDGLSWVGTCRVDPDSRYAGWSPDASVEYIAWSTGLRLEMGHTTLGDELLVDEAGKIAAVGRIAAVAPSGARRSLDIEPGCRPIHGDARRALVLANCGEPGSVQLDVFDARGRHRLGRVDSMIYELRVLSPRFVELAFFDVPHQWLDLDGLRLYKNTPGEAVAIHGTYALIHKNDNVIVDLATGHARLLGPTRFFFRPVRSAARYVYAYPWLVDLERGRPLAKLDRVVHAVTRDGRLLVDTGRGVLRWRPWKQLARR